MPAPTPFEGAPVALGPTSGALPRDLPTLTSLRAVAALMVFVFHLNLFGVVPLPWAGLGFTGVSFFFVLSGFVLTWSAPSVLSSKTFYRRRIARVYPSHVAMLLVWLAAIVAFGGTFPTAGALVANLFLVQAWSSVPGTVFGLNAVSWSLSCEAAFYAGFPFLLRGLRRSSSRVWVAVPLAWISISLLAATTSPAVSGYLYHFPLARMGEFVLGMSCALLVRRGWGRWTRLPPAFVVLGVALAALTLVQSWSGTVPSGVVDSLVAVPFATVICAAATSDVLGRTRLLAHRWFVYAGQVSFAFYLVHQLVIITVSKTGRAGPEIVVLDLVLASIAAILLHHVVERPMQRYLSRGISRRPAPLTT